MSAGACWLSQLLPPLGTLDTPRIPRGRLEARSQFFPACPCPQGDTGSDGDHVRTEGRSLSPSPPWGSRPSLPQDPAPVPRTAAAPCSWLSTGQDRTASWEQGRFTHGSAFPQPGHLCGNLDKNAFLGPSLRTAGKSRPRHLREKQPPFPEGTVEGGRTGSPAGPGEERPTDAGGHCTA